MKKLTLPEAVLLTVSVLCFGLSLFVYEVTIAQVMSLLAGLVFYTLAISFYKDRVSDKPLQELERGAQEAGANQTTFNS